MTNFTDEAMQLAAREAAERAAREAADRAAREASERAAREAGQAGAREAAQALDSQVAGLVGNARQGDQFLRAQDAVGFRDPRHFQRLPTVADAEQMLGQGAARMQARRENNPRIFQGVPPPPTDPTHPEFFKIKVVPAEATKTGDSAIDDAAKRIVDDGVSPLTDGKTFKERVAANLGIEPEDPRIANLFDTTDTLADEVVDTGTMKRAALEVVNTPEAVETAARRLELDRAQFMPRQDPGNSYNFLQRKSVGLHDEAVQEAAKKSARELQETAEIDDIARQIRQTLKESDESRSIVKKISDNSDTIMSWTIGITLVSMATFMISGITVMFLLVFGVIPTSNAENFMMYRRENLEQFPDDLRFATPEEVEQNVRALFQTVDQGIIEPNELVFLLNQVFEEARQLNISLTPEFEDEVKDMTRELYEMKANKEAILEGRVLLSDIVEPVDPSILDSQKPWYSTSGGMTMIGLGVFALVMVLIFVFFMMG